MCFEMLEQHHPEMAARSDDVIRCRSAEGDSVLAIQWLL